MDRDFLTLGIISSIVAHDMTAVEDMIRVLARIDPKWAEQIMDALKRGIAARALDPERKTDA